MPIYEYRCSGCKKHLEIMQKITEKPLAKCPECGGDLRKLISNTSFVLKGTGWYATDYASGKSACSTAKKDSPSGQKTEKKEATSATPAKKETAVSGS